MSNYNLFNITKDKKNISKYLRTLNKYNNSKIIEISYDGQSGNYILNDNNEKIASVYEYFSKKISDFINNTNIIKYNILEIGVGEGNLFYRICKQLNNKYLKSYGLDISLSRLFHAQNICKINSINNCDFICADFKNIPLKDNSIDFIISCHAIEPNKDEEEIILKELYRVTNKYLILIEPSFDDFDSKQKEYMIYHNYIQNLTKICKKLNYKVLYKDINKKFFNELNKSIFLIIEKKTFIKNDSKLVSPLEHNKLDYHLNNYFDNKNKLIFPIINNINIFTTNILCNKFLSF